MLLRSYSSTSVSIPITALAGTLSFTRLSTGAKAVIEPLSGSLVREKSPVFTQSVQEELNGIIQRKYEVIDHKIPEGIEQTATHVVKDSSTDEEKARKLYDWVGDRITYDHDKVTLYEERGYGKSRHRRIRTIQG